MKTNLLTKIGNSNKINSHIDKVIRNDAYAAKTLVTINVVKDVFAYATRFKTTMSNKEIPEEKRPFVASMDLMSGVVTAAMQIGVGYSLASPKFQDKIWDKLFKNCNFKNITSAKKGFSQILALIGSTVLAERLLVPLIATPCAEKVEKKFFKKLEQKQMDRFDNLNNASFEKFNKSTSKTNTFIG